MTARFEPYATVVESPQGPIWHLVDTLAPVRWNGLANKSRKLALCDALIYRALRQDGPFTAEQIVVIPRHCKRCVKEAKKIEAGGR